jgi:hypothetical protein
MRAGYFGAGFLRGLNSVSELFMPYSYGHGHSTSGAMRFDWSTVEDDRRNVPRSIPTTTSQDIAERQPADGGGAHRSGTRIVSSRWSGPLPPPAELEKIDQIIPGGADRLLCMAEKKLCMVEKKLCMTEKEQVHRIEDTKRGQYLGWSLAAGAVISATVVSLCHAPWQVAVALVGIPVLGAVQALIQGR